MKPSNLEAVNRSFELQAPGFESSEVPFTKETYLEEMISYAAPEKQDVVLEVAAGTCACGRSFAPLVQTVVCLDATLSMLQVGKRGGGSSPFAQHGLCEGLRGRAAVFGRQL